MRGHFLDLTELKGKSDGVLIAMSGGVDSAVAAFLVQQAGLRAIGLTMKNYCYGDAEVPDRSCCSVEAINDARRECDRLGIPHRVADAEELFTREVIDNFISEYENARTPNPCVRCNSIVRFQTLFEYADRLGLSHVATGHYARVFEADSGGRYLARSTNREKDQSYFLSGVRGEVLSRVIFPLGDYDKGAVREIAGSASMDVAAKKESQEVCFVPDGTLRSFLESRGVPLRPGTIETVEGSVLGMHDGLSSYTVGQRRGLGVATGRPRYVVALDHERNVLVVGDTEDLLSRELNCRLTWIDPDAVREPAGLNAQIRYRHGGSGEVRDLAIDGSRCRVLFVETQRAVCPGQTIALYRDELVVGSGVIERD
jgi:tRNA-specific 2-thiouridylase